MKETKGLVMKITDQFIVVMCDDGKFRNLPLPKKVPSVGERISVPLRKKKRIPYAWLYSAAACLFIFIGISIFFQAQPKYDQVIAIDINPSLELYLDSEDRVVEVKPLNTDAEKVLDHFPSGKLISSEAIEQIIARSIALGYINKDKENMIMITAARLRGDSVINSSMIETAITKILKAEQINAYLKVDQADEALYNKAKEKKVSLNTWLLIQQAEQLGIHIDADKAASESMAKVLQDAGINMQQFFEPIRVSITQEKNDHQPEGPLVEQKDNAESLDQPMLPAETSVENAGGTAIPSDVVTNNTRQQKTIDAPSQKQRKLTNPMGPLGTTESSKSYEKPGASNTSDISEAPKASNSSQTTGSSEASSSSGLSGSAGSYGSSSSSGASSSSSSSSSASDSSKTSSPSGSSGASGSSSSYDSSSSDNSSNSSSSSDSSSSDNSSSSSSSSDSSSSDSSNDSSSSSGSGDSNSSESSDESTSSGGYTW